MDERTQRALFGRGPGLHRVLIILGLVWIGGIVLQPWPGGSAHISNLGLTICPLLAGGRCLLRSRHAAGRVRRAWVLLGLSALSWGGGMVLWSWYESIQGQAVPFPSAADVGFLGAVPLAVAGLLVFPAAPRRVTSVLRMVLDGLVIGASLLFVSWAWVLGPVIRTGSGSLSAQVISLAYPLGDVVMITIVLFAISRMRGGAMRPVTLWLLCAGLCANALADSAFVYLALQDSYLSGSFIDIGWFLGYGVVFTAAARDASPTGMASEDRVPSPSSVVLPYAAVVLVALATGVKQILEGQLEVFLVWNALALLLLVVGRHVLVLLEHLSLLRTLESRVQQRTEALTRSEERFRSLVANSSDVVTVVAPDSTVQYQSPSAPRVFGTDDDLPAGTMLSDRVDLPDRGRFLELLADVARRPFASVVTELDILRSDGHGTHAEMTITNLLEDPSVAGLVLNTRDISERKRLEDELLHQAFHDSLTGLANRALFRDRVQHALTRQKRWRRQVAVLFLDLDGFKVMNDSYGHSYGDQILVAVAERLSSALRRCDTAARLGGDEFAVLVEDLTGEAGTFAVAQRLSDAIGQGFVIDGREVMVSASIGIALSETGRETADELLRNADLAMYRAKTQGRTYRRYDPTMYEALVERVELEAELRHALGRGELAVHYQPIVELASGRVKGVEALLRWYHPERGAISPGDFIPVAEASGLIVSIGEWALRQACDQVSAWHQRIPGCADLSVSVNLSAKQTHTPGLADLVLTTLEEAGLSAGSLTLEMTESIMMGQGEETLATLRTLRELGVRLAIDDFGTGYSSLSYLHRLPVDVVKIDRSFISRLTSETDEAALARSIVQIGRSMHLETVAEGIETPEQLELLQQMGCQFGQGFLFARPMPATDLEAYLWARAGVTENIA